MARINMKHAAGLLLAGAAAGATIALLYTPENRLRNKKDLRKFARNTVDRIDDLHVDIRDKVSQWVDDMTEVVNDGVVRGKKLGAQGYEQVLQGFDNAKKCVEDGKARFEELIKSA
jgi:gas vesicle protein